MKMIPHDLATSTILNLCDVPETEDIALMWLRLSLADSMIDGESTFVWQPEPNNAIYVKYGQHMGTQVPPGLTYVLQGRAGSGNVRAEWHDCDSSAREQVIIPVPTNMLWASLSKYIAAPQKPEIGMSGQMCVMIPGRTVTATISIDDMIVGLPAIRVNVNGYITATSLSSLWFTKTHMSIAADGSCVKYIPNVNRRRSWNLGKDALRYMVRCIAGIGKCVTLGKGSTLDSKTNG